MQEEITFGFLSKLSDVEVEDITYSNINLHQN